MRERLLSKRFGQKILNRGISNSNDGFDTIVPLFYGDLDETVCRQTMTLELAPKFIIMRLVRLLAANSFAVAAKLAPYVVDTGRGQSI